MKPLTLDDVMPLRDHVAQRAELFEAHCRYVDRYRRVRLGPRATLIFENRQTIWFRVQEILRVARLTQPDQVRHLLNVYNALLPGRNCLQAGLLIESPDEADWQSLTGEKLRLRIGANEYPSQLLTTRPEDRCFGTAHWTQFHLDAKGRDLLGEPHCLAQILLQLFADTVHEVTLTDAVRGSINEDLKSSDRDAA